MVKLSKLSLESVVKSFVTTGITFKNETYLSSSEGEEYAPEKEFFVDDVIYDNTDKEQFQCALSFNSDLSKSVIDHLTKEFGEPTEMRGDNKTNPVWKFGKKDVGQLWIYPSEGKTIVDIRCWYEKS